MRRTCYLMKNCYGDICGTVTLLLEKSYLYEGGCFLLQIWVEILDSHLLIL